MSLVRAAARLMLPDLIAEGLASRAITERLRQTVSPAFPKGISPRRKDLLEDLRYFRGTKKSRDVMKFTRKDRVPEISAFAPGRVPKGRNYMYHVELVGVDAYTGEEASQYVSVLSNERQRPTTTEQDAIDLYQRKAEDPSFRQQYPLSVIRAVVHEGIKDVGMP